MSWRRIHALGGRITPRLERALVRAFEEARGRVPVTAIEQLIRAHGLRPLDVVRVTNAIPMLVQAAAAPVLFKATRNAAVLAEIEVTELVGAAPRLDLVNPAAVHVAGTQTAKLVTQVTLQTRQAIRSIIEAAIRDGLPPRESAKLIRTVVGLTERQAMSVVNFRARLLRMGATRDTAAAAGDRYAGKQLRRRALTIARTETLDALSAGQDVLWGEAQRRGYLPPGAMQRWIITPDDRLCRYCRQMTGARALAPIGGYFQTPLGPRRGPTMHPNCRCTKVIDPKSLGLRRTA